MDVKKLYPYMLVEAIAMIGFAAGLIMENQLLTVSGFILIFIGAFALSFALIRDVRRRQQGNQTGSSFFTSNMDASGQPRGDHPYAPNAPTTPYSPNSPAFGQAAQPYAPDPHQPQQVPPPHAQDSAWGKSSSQQDDGPFHQGR